MFVRNWYNISYLTMFGGNFPDDYALVNMNGTKLTDSSGVNFNATVYQNPVFPETAYTSFSSSNTAVLIGTDTEVNFDDYKMSTTLNVKATLDKSAFSYSYDETNKCMVLKSKVQLSNQVGTEQTISSYCLTQYVKVYGTYNYNYDAVMIYKEILETPITIPASETSYMEIEIKYQLPNQFTPN